MQPDPTTITRRDTKLFSTRLAAYGDDETSWPGTLDPIDVGKMRALVALADHALSEPDRIEAARREGIAEGIEKAARYFETLAAEAARGNDGITTAQRCYDARLVRKLIPATKATAPITEPPHA